jgi:prevent-host-death family protein
MKYSEEIKSISYLKAHASEVLRDVSDNQKTLVITHNGEAKVVLQDVRIYDKTMESIALLKILALSSKEQRKGNYKSLDRTFKDVRKKVDEFKKGQNAI